MRILVVDDEIKIRNGLKKLIKQYNSDHEIKTASNGLDALEIVKLFKPDLIFLDIKMPLMNGLEFAKKVKISYPETLIVMVSGFAEFDYAKEAVSIGVLDYILKPVMPKKVMFILEKAEREYKKICFEKEKTIRYYEAVIFEILDHGKDISLGEVLKTEGKYKIIYGKYMNEKKDYNYNISDEKKHSITKAVKDNFENQLNVYGFFIKNDLIVITINDESNLEMILGNINYKFLEFYISDFYNMNDSFYENYTDLVKNTSKDALMDTLKNYDENGIINIIIKYIEENYQKNINLKDISDLVYLNSSYVSKLFKKNTGINLSDYMTLYRIKIAKEILCDPQYKIYEVAYKVGFNGPKYFNKVFKSKTGMTPLEFRNRNIDN